MCAITDTRKLVAAWSSGTIFASSEKDPEQPHKLRHAVARKNAVGRVELALGTDGKAHSWFATLIGNAVVSKRHDVGQTSCDLERSGAFAAGHAARGERANIGKESAVEGRAGTEANRTRGLAFRGLRASRIVRQGMRKYIWPLISCSDASIAQW